MKNIFVILLLLLLTSFDAFAAWEIKDLVTYFGTTDQTITCKWDPVTNATGYQVELLHVERDSITRVDSDTVS